MAERREVIRVEAGASGRDTRRDSSVRGRSETDRNSARRHHGHGHGHWRARRHHGIAGGHGQRSTLRIHGWPSGSDELVNLSSILATSIKGGDRHDTTRGEERRRDAPHDLDEVREGKVGPLGLPRELENHIRPQQLREMSQTRGGAKRSEPGAHRSRRGGQRQTRARSPAQQRSGGDPRRGRGPWRQQQRPWHPGRARRAC